MKIEDIQDSLTLLEAARVARLHPSTIRRAVHHGELPHFRVVGKIRIQPAELQDFLLREYRGPGKLEEGKR